MIYLAKTKKELAFEEVKEALDSAADALLDDGDDLDLQEFESDPRRMNFKTILKKYADGELVIPPYQRRFVWTPKKQKEFYETIEEAIPTPSMIFAEWNGVLSLMDGFQRFTTLSIMSNNPRFTKEQQKKVKEYKVDTITIFDMPPMKQRRYFQKYNSGILVSGIIKQRANLNESIESLVTKMVSELFPEDLNTSISFNKSAHHDTISENALLAVSGVKLDSNRPEMLVKLLNENEEAVLQNQDAARSIIKRIMDIYQKNIRSDLVKRSMNANFVSILIRVLADNPDIQDTDIIQVIKYIFAGNKAVPEYAQTTSGSGGEAGNCIVRYELLSRLLKNPPAVPEEPIKKPTFKQFVKQYKDANITDSAGNFIVDFNQFSNEQKQALYDAQDSGTQLDFDSLIKSKYDETKE